MGTEAATSEESFFLVRMPDGGLCWVVGWFIIIDICPETVYAADATGVLQKFIVWMIKLRKADLSSHSFWARSDQRSPPMDHRNFSVLRKNGSEHCDACGEDCKCILTQGWLCLKEKCPDFWKIDGTLPAAGDELTYSDDFVQERVQPPSINLPPFHADFNSFYQDKYLNAIKPDPTKAEMTDLMESIFSGFCCPECANLSRRRAWSFWKCSNPHCNFEVSAPVLKLSLDQLALFEGPELEDFTKSKFHARTEESGDYRMHVFDLAEACAVFFFVPKPDKGNPASVLANGMLDKILEYANSGELELERRSTQSLTSDAITNHFASNFGKHYFYGATDMRNIPFDEAPSEIRQAVQKAQSLTQPLSLSTSYTWADTSKGVTWVRIPTEKLELDLSLGRFRSAAKGKSNLKRSSTI